MQNFVQRGDVVPMTAPYDVDSGDGLLVGSLFGIATTGASSGALVEAQLVGVFDISKKSTDNIAAGAAVYWDNAGKYLTTTAAGNKLVGAAIDVAVNGTNVVRARLNGVAS